MLSTLEADFARIPALLAGGRPHEPEAAAPPAPVPVAVAPVPVPAAARETADEQLGLF
jgi:hypothetical protein